MSKICLIGDPHFANRKLFGFPTAVKGRNTRLDSVIRAFEWIDQKLKDDYPEVETVYILGDITHDHGIMTPAVFDAVQTSVYALTKGGNREVLLLSGNHDQDIHGLSIIKVFGTCDDCESASVFDIDEIFPRQFGGMQIYPVSYGSDLSQLWVKLAIDKARKADPAILLMHHHFEGAVHGPHEFEVPGGLALKDIPDNVALVVSGHYHKWQWIGNRVLYIGAPIQHDFGEATYLPGFTILTVHDDSKRKPDVEFVEIPEGEVPRFHILPHTLTPANLPGIPALDYYRVDLPMDVDPASIEWLHKAVQHLAVKPLPSTTELRSRVEQYFIEAGTQQPEGRVDLGEVIEAYTMLNVEDEGRQQDLIRIGKEIANKVVSGS